jgi:UDP-glucuronate 4-epimerase
MHILVTGGAGFIGSHLVEKLLARGDQVIVIDNFHDFYDPAVKENNVRPFMDHADFSLQRIDISNFSALENVFQQNKVDLVVHLAARAGVRPSILDPLGYYQTNVQGTLNLLELCRTFRINRFVFASSSSVYGNNKKVPFSEDDPVDHPISPYAATKKAGELLCHTYHHLYHINIFALRFFTVYGPRQRPDLAIHKFFNLIYRNQEIPFFGDGTTSRDYTYIDDTIQGIMAAIDRVHGFQIINLGESQPISLQDLVQQIEKVSGKTVKKQPLPMQPGDVLKTYADISKATKLLDYKPGMPIDRGLQIFKRWFEENRKLLLKT